MTRTKWICAVAATLLALSVGCQPENGNDVDAEDVQRESAEAIDKAHKYASEEVDQFVEESERAIARLESRADRWAEEAEELGQEAEAAGRKELAEIEAKAAEARQRLKKLRDQGDDAWVELKKGADAALTELQRAYDRAAERFDKDS